VALIIDPGQWPLVLVAAFAGALVGGIGGFGSGVILAAVLVPVLGVKATVPVLAIAGVLINAGRLWFHRADIDWVATRRVLAGALPLLVVGTWLHSRLDARPLGLVMGLLVMLSVPARRWLRRRRLDIDARGMVAGGAVFGLANGMASGMGVMLVSLLLGGGLAGTAVLATDALVSVLVDLLRAALFGRLEALDGERALLGLLIGVATLPGSALAAWLVRRLRARLHTLLMEALIIVGGLGIVAAAWRETVS
jgi:uncharacterized membrane protein YfcA